MSRTSIVFSLGLLAGCSFVDDFDKFKAADESAIGDDAGQTVADAAAMVDPGKPDATTGTPDATTGTPDTGAVTGNDAATDSGSAASDAAVDAGPSGPACVPANCDDGDPCTANMCTAGVCSNPAIDADNDGYSPGVCKAGSKVRGGDCNDNKPEIKPGATEVCDNVDNNCDGLADEGFSKLACYPDVDRDGFANLNVAAVLACTTCPATTIPVANPTDKTQHDCYDVADPDGERVYPGQKGYYDQGYGPGGKNERSFDYDCSGMVEAQYKALNGGCGGLLGLLCDGSAGFTGKELPACGETGEYQMCFTSTLTCEGNTMSLKQQCH